MKKTLIASAIAAAAMSTPAFAMDSVAELAARMDAMAGFYGNIQLAYVYDKVDPDGGSEITSNDFLDNGTTLGWKHSHEISPGLTGFMKVEYDIDSDQKGANQFSLDEGYLGVKGGFGSVQVGSDDTPYEWFDVIDMYEAVGLDGEFQPVNEGDNLQYVSNTIAGGLTIGVSVALDSTEKHAGSLGVKYKTDMFEGILSYALGREEGGVDYGDGIGLGGRVFLGDFTLGAEVEMQAANSVNGTDDKSSEQTGFGLIGIYALGANQFAFGYQHTEDDADTSTETDAFYLQALHNLSDNMYAYVEYLNGTTDVGSASVDGESLAIGATYYF